MPIFKFQTSAAFLEYGEFRIPTPVFSGVELLSGSGTFTVPSLIFGGEGNGYGTFGLVAPKFSGTGYLHDCFFSLPTPVFSGAGDVEVYAVGQFSISVPAFAGLCENIGQFRIPLAAFSGYGIIDTTGTGDFKITLPLFSGDGFLDVAGNCSFTIPTLAFSGAATLSDVQGEAAFGIPVVCFLGAGEADSDFVFAESSDAVLRFSNGRRFI